MSFQMTKGQQSETNYYEK